MIFGFDFQRDEVSFSFLLSHPTALSCISDIYNAAADGASSVMLTGETAAGQYPVEAMEYLVRTARTALE